MEKIKDLLFEKAESGYADFISGLTPNEPKEIFIGVRVPFIRKLVKRLSKEEKEVFLKELPHKYYEENLLHGFLVQEIKDYPSCIKKIEEFLPYVNNWATCDTMMPKCFNKNKEDVLKNTNIWIKSKHTFTVRFAVLCLMKLFLEEDFKPEYLKLVTSIKSEEYYINIIVAWYLAEALLKQYDTTVELLKTKTLPKWIQNKGIQKACESNRIAQKIKDYLKTLKI